MRPLPLEAVRGTFLHRAVDALMFVKWVMGR